MDNMRLMAQGLAGSSGTGPPTGATAGTPGTWTPAGSSPPASVATIGNVTASPATAWTAGQYVQTATAGAPGQAHWTGSAWAAGTALTRDGEPDPPEEPKKRKKADE